MNLSQSISTKLHNLRAYVSMGSLAILLNALVGVASPQNPTERQTSSPSFGSSNATSSPVMRIDVKPLPPIPSDAAQRSNAASKWPVLFKTREPSRETTPIATNGGKLFIGRDRRDETPSGSNNSNDNRLSSQIVPVENVPIENTLVPLIDPRNADARTVDATWNIGNGQSNPQQSTVRLPKMLSSPTNSDGSVARRHEMPKPIQLNPEGVQNNVVLPESGKPISINLPTQDPSNEPVEPMPNAAQVRTYGESVPAAEQQNGEQRKPEPVIDIAPMAPINANTLPSPFPTVDPNPTQSSSLPVGDVSSNINNIPSDPSMSPQAMVPKSGSMPMLYPSLTDIQQQANAINNSLLPSDALSVDLSNPLPNPWWQSNAQQQLLTNDPNRACIADLEQLIMLAMQYSPNIQAILTVPKIQRTEISEAQARFDPSGNAQTLFHNSSDPVGNTLTTGGPKRLEEVFWENSMGAKHINTFGGQADWTQVINSRDNNSVFFKPNQQADTKLTLNYTQPLMRGAGREYNTAQIRIAGLKTQGSIANANLELQKHALEITNVYWDLVASRYQFTQSLNAINRLQALLELLKNREGVDALRTHLFKAEQFVAQQQSAAINARLNIIRDQGKLRRLVHSPELLDARCEELIPLTLPVDNRIPIDVESEFVEALQSRGDILLVQYQMQQAIVERRIAMNELKPQLNAITSAYVRGLKGDYNEGRAFSSQFDEGRPSYTAGFSYQRPAANRQARANELSKSREFTRLTFIYEDTLADTRSKILGAIAQVDATYAQTQAAAIATFAAVNEVEEQKTKFFTEFAENQSKSTILYELLDAENRLIQAELNWARQQEAHMLALAQVKFESGTLLSVKAE